MTKLSEDSSLSPEHREAAIALDAALGAIDPPADMPAAVQDAIGELQARSKGRLLSEEVERLRHAWLATMPRPGENLRELARPFPSDFVERKDNQDYVAHHIINQRLLSVVGPFSFELVQVIRGDVPAVAPDATARSRRGKAGTPELRNVVVGGVWRLRVTIDGEPVQVEEVGDVGDVHNWPTDGARLKDAASDALKRCCMRIGLGLHLWAQEHYFLHGQLQAQQRQYEEAVEGG